MFSYIQTIVALLLLTRRFERFVGIWLKIIKRLSLGATRSEYGGVATDIDGPCTGRVTIAQIGARK